MMKQLIFILTLATLGQAYATYMPFPVSSGGSLVRAEYAFIGNNGTCTIAQQSGNWLSSVSHSATGQCALTIASGIFSSNTSIACSCGGVTNNDLCWVSNITNTAAVTNTTTITLGSPSSLGNQVDHNVTVICSGLRSQ